MSGTTGVPPGMRAARTDLGQTEHLARLLRTAAAQPAVRTEVIRNHDDNRWWPRDLADWRLRLVVAGWSARVSYRAIGVYREVVAAARSLGFDRLRRLDDDAVACLVRPLGLATARTRLLRGFDGLVRNLEAAGLAPASIPNDLLIRRIAAGVPGAGFKLAQCATLYAKGYHCGVIPVDTGMLELLAPCLGMRPPRGSAGHEVVRQTLEGMVRAAPERFRAIAEATGYAGRVTLPALGPPTWWVHLVLVYFKRLHCNQHNPDACPLRADPALAGWMGTRCARPAGGAPGAYPWVLPARLAPQGRPR